MNTSTLAGLRPAFVAGALGLVVIGLVPFAALGDSSTNVSVHIALTGSPGARKVELSWPSQPGAVYKLDHRTSLDAGHPWQTIDVFQPTGTMFRVTLDGDPLKEEAAFREVTGFFRLILPEAAIFGIEPARFPLGGPTLLHVIGQCFDSNATLRVHGGSAPAFQIDHPGLMRTSFTPQSAGTYVFELLVRGTVASSFAVECFDPAAPPTSVLQGPPEAPWASPVSEDPSGKSITPAPLKAKEKGNRTKCTSNLRVTPSGELEAEAVDLFVPGVGLDFVWARRYRSRSGPNSEQGNRWDFSYNVRATPVAGGMEVRDGSGRADVFPQAADGTFGRDEHFCVGTLTGLVFRLAFADTGYWEFLPHNGTAAAGRLARIVDRNGNALRLEYDGLGRLARVVDTLDRTNTIAYSPLNGKIASVTDFSGRRVTYAYYRSGDAGGNDGDLRSATAPPVTGTPNGNDFPAGKTETYTYSRGFADPRENSLLLTVTDAKGQTAHEHVYQHNQTDLEFIRVRAARIGLSNHVVTYTYLALTSAPSNGFATQKILVNDRVGNVSEHLYDARHRLIALREFTGRALPGLQVSDTTNRPVGQLRPDDPAYFETRFEWNNDSLCTRVVHPRGNLTEMLYQRAFNQNSSRSNNARRHEGNLRVQRERACCGGADTDGDGLDDTVELVTRFEYDPRFGTSTGGRGSGLGGTTRGTVATGRIETGYASRDFSSIDNAPEEKERGFVTTTIDPRGATSAAVFDAFGNCTHTETYARKNGAIIACDYVYDARGRLTSVTHPADGEGRRRVDTFSYHDSGPQAGYCRESVRDHGANRLNLVTTYEYDSRGNLTRCVNPRGLDTLWAYNALDQCVLRQTPNTSFGTLVRNGTSYFYDANDNLVQVDQENRDHTGALDAANPVWSSFAEYDLLDRQTLLGHELTHIVQQGHTNVATRWHYDANDNLILVESPEAVRGADPNNVVSCSFDERDLPFQIVRAPGTGLAATNRFDYDANANCRRVNKVDAFSIKQRTFEHDGFDRAVRMTDAMGNVTTRAFDRGGNLVCQRLDGELEDEPGSAKNRRLSEARYEYDLLHRPTRFRPAFFDVFTELAIGDGQATTSFDYAPNGQLLSETDDNGRTTLYAYDTACRLLNVRDAKTNAVTYGYDGNDNVTSVTQVDRSDLGGPEQSFGMTYEFDALDRCLSATDNLGNADQYFYDSRDNLVRHIDPRGTLTGWGYDGLSRVTIAVGDLNGDGLLDAAADIGSVSAYDDNSRLVSTTDDNGNVTRFAYDAVDRLVVRTNADNTTFRLVWSPRSNLIQSTDPNGTRVTYTYDLSDRCTRKDIQVGPGVAATTTLETFAYDGESRLVRAMTSPGGLEHTFVWNSLSDLAEQSGGGLTLRATHDGVGNRTSLRYPSGLVVGFTHDALNQVTSMTRCQGCNDPWRGDLIASFSYDGPGRIAGEARANGMNTRINWGGYAGALQLPGDFGWRQVTRVNHQLAQGGAFLDTRAFAHDRAQNRTVRAQMAPFSTGGLLTTNRFTYDPMHRLVDSITLRGAMTDKRSLYGLDGNGNRQVVTENSVPTTYQLDNSTPEPADFQMNQYTRTPFGPRAYDRNGNQVSVDGPAGATRFHYDYADRLVRVDRDVGPAMVPVAACAYDALGRRVSQTVFPPAPLAPVTTHYVYDGSNPIEERDAAGIVGKSFVLDGSRSTDDGTIQTFRWTQVRGPFATIEASGATVFHHLDDLGNVLALTDAGGSVLERYEYDDYGLPHFLDAKGDPLTDATGQPVVESPAGNRFLFYGMEWDAETGLYYSRSGNNPLYESGGMSGSNPMYEPRSGRHLSRVEHWGDPHENLGGRAQSTFAGNNPWSASRKPGRSKWPNLVLKQGFAGGGGEAGGSAIEVMFNPKEYTIDKAVSWGSKRSKEDVYVWKLKAEGGRHTPFNNKRYQGGPGDVAARNVLISRDATPKISDFGMARTSGDNTPIIRGAALGGLNSDARAMSTRADVDPYEPGQPHWGRAMLGGSKELQAWWGEAAKGKNIRKNITVTLRKHSSASGRRYNLMESFPTRWDSGDYSASSSPSVMHWTLEVRVQRIEMK